MPVEDQRFGDDDQRGTLDEPLAEAVLQQRQKLNRLPQPHVVGQAPAETEALQELEPTDPGPLIGTQFPGETRGLGHGLDARKLADLTPQLVEALVEAHRLLGRQQGVEQAHLRAREADMVSFRQPQTGKQTVLADPFLRHDPQRAIVEAYCAVSPGQRRKQFRKGNTPPLEIDPRRQLEPVDSRFDLETQRPGLVDLFAVSVNLPAVPEERPDDSPQEAGGDLDVAAAMKDIEQPAGANLSQFVPRQLFALAVTGDAPPQLALHDRSLGARAANDRAFV